MEYGLVLEKEKKLKISNNLTKLFCFLSITTKIVEFEPMTTSSLIAHIYVS